LLELSLLDSFVLSPDFQSLDDLSGLSTMDSIGVSRALPKEASGNDLSWAYAMKNDLLGKKFCAYVDGSLQFPKTREGYFPTKDEKCLASNEMTCVLPLSPIYTVTSFATAKDIWETISHLDSQDDSPPFYQLQHEEHALAYG